MKEKKGITDRQTDIVRHYALWSKRQKEKHVLSIEILCSLDHCRQTDGQSEIYSTCSFITKNWLSILRGEGVGRKILEP